MAVVATVRDRCQVARRHLWKKAACGPAFAELTAAVKELDELGTTLSARWQELFETATKGEHHAETVDHPTG